MTDKAALPVKGPESIGGWMQQARRENGTSENRLADELEILGLLGMRPVRIRDIAGLSARGPESIGARMQQALRENATSEDRLADELGMRPVRIRDIENNRWEKVTLHDLDRAGKALGLSFSILVNREETAL